MNEAIDNKIKFGKQEFKTNSRATTMSSLANLFTRMNFNSERKKIIQDLRDNADDIWTILNNKIDVIRKYNLHIVNGGSCLRYFGL